MACRYIQNMKSGRPSPTTTTIRVRSETKTLLQSLSTRTGASASDLLAKILREYERELFFRELNAGYSALRSNESAWKEVQEERAIWDETLNDGLEGSMR